MADYGATPPDGYTSELTPGAIYLGLSPADYGLAETLKRLLEGEGFKVWFASAGTGYDAQESRSRLERCSIYAPVLTPEALDDNDLMRECALALHMLNEAPDAYSALQICGLATLAVMEGDDILIEKLRQFRAKVLNLDPAQLQSEGVRTLRDLYERWHEIKLAKEAQESGADMGDKGQRVFAGASLDPQAGELVDALQDNALEETAAISVLSPDELRKVGGHATDTVPDVEFGAPPPEPAIQEPETNPSAETPEPAPPAQERNAKFPPANVQFSAFRPAQLQTEVWSKLVVFGHRHEDEPGVMSKVRNLAEEAGSQKPDKEKLEEEQEALPAPRAEQITLAPRVYGVQFSPPELRFEWSEKESVHQLEFGMRASMEMEDETVQGSIVVYLGSVMLTEIPLQFEVLRGSADGSLQPSPAADPIQKLFPAFSLEDQDLVDQLGDFAASMENSFLQEALLERRVGASVEQLRPKIEAAEVFQLFWTQAASGSSETEEEVEFAQSLNRPGFVRPVFWGEAKPATPESLYTTHFYRLGVGRPEPEAAPEPIPEPAPDPVPVVSRPTQDPAPSEPIGPIASPMRPPPGKEVKETDPNWRGGGQAPMPPVSQPSVRSGTRSTAQPWNEVSRDPSKKSPMKTAPVPQVSKGGAGKKNSSKVGLFLGILGGILAIGIAIFVIQRLL